MNKEGGTAFKSIIASVLSFVFLLLFINTYFISITKISGASMEPTFTTGNQVLFNRIISFTPSAYEHGDVVVCRFGMKEYNSEENTFVQNNTSTYIKRIIALEGDTIEISDGKVFVNNEDVTDKYWNGVIVQDTLLKLKIPKGHVFVIGDNINNSIDSRVVGSLPYSNLLGKVTHQIQYKSIFGENSSIKFPTFKKIG
jgi:signal peptidase I